MVYSIGTVAAAEQSALDGDKPVILCSNLLNDQNTQAIWVAPSAAHGNPGTWSDTDKTLSTHPTKRLHDYFTHLVTQPDTTTPSDSWALLFDFNIGTDDAHTFDSLYIGNHNFASVAASIGEVLHVEVHIADDNAFSSNAQTIYSAEWDTTDAPRIIDFKLGNNTADRDSITNIKWVQILMYSDSVSNNFTPKIGEVIFGRRRQLSRQPNVPYDDKHWESDESNFTSDSGIDSGYIKHKGRRIFTPKWNPDGNDTYGLNDVNTLETLFTTDADYGTRRCLYVPEPNTSLVNGFWCKMEPALSFDILGPAERRGNFSFTEQAPFVASD